MPLYPAAEKAADKPKVPKFEELPIWSHVGEIKAALERSQIVMVQGPPRRRSGCSSLLDVRIRTRRVVSGHSALKQTADNPPDDFLQRR